MEQAPGHGSNLVEELESNTGLSFVDYTSVCQEAKECIHLFCRPVRNSPMIEPVSTNPAVALAEIGSDRA